MIIFYILTIFASLPIIAYLLAQKTSSKGIIFGISVIVLSFCLTIFVSKFALVAVSYTHLTLPTKRIV